MTDEELQAIRDRHVLTGARIAAGDISHELVGDVAKLLAEVDRLREENRKLHALLDGAAT